MRVITGSAKGRKLLTLDGLATRPTTDRVKEAVFDIVQFNIPGKRFLDLFSGSGQMGIEALSRGAERAVMIDKLKKACDIINKNVKACGFVDKTKVQCMDSLSYLMSTTEKFDVIYIDPPYASDLVEKSLELIMRFDILCPNGIIICESPEDKELPELNEPYFKKKKYRYGKINVVLYGRN